MSAYDEGIAAVVDRDKIQGLSKLHPWMNDAQFECWMMFCDLVGGAHHQFGKVRSPGKNGVEITESFPRGWASFDFGLLTRAVVLAHDRCIRFSVAPCNFQYLRFYLHKRYTREGQTNERHPTIEEALSIIRGEA